MAQASDEIRLRVAIVGAGIAGLVSAIGLLQIEGVDVQVYDKARALREVGASIALGPNGIKGLRELGLGDVVDTEGYRNPSTLDHPFRDGRTGELLWANTYPSSRDPPNITHRFARSGLQTGLLRHLPKERLYLQKTLRRFETSAEGVTLYFEDGDTVKADILVGADGNRSSIRTHYLPDYKLRFSGNVAFREVFDKDRLQNVLGNLDDATHFVNGSDRYFFASPLAHNKFAYAAIINGLPPDHPYASKWSEAVSPAVLQQEFKDLYPPLKGITQAAQNPRLYPIMIGNALDTWIYDNRVVLIGDAAHPHGASFAAGGSLGTNDAQALTYAIQYLLKLSPEKPIATDLAFALKLFDETRCPIGKRLINVTKGTILPMSSFIDKARREELTPELIETQYPLWVGSHDVGVAFREVLKRHQIASEKGTIRAKL